MQKEVSARQEEAADSPSSLREAPTYEYLFRKEYLLLFVGSSSVTSGFCGLMHRTVAFLLALLRMNAGSTAFAAAHGHPQRQLASSQLGNGARRVKGG